MTLTPFHRDIILLLILAGLTFPSRLLHLDQFLGPDEIAQWGRANQFMLALIEGDIAATHTRNDTGNLTLMWIETLSWSVRYLLTDMRGNLREIVPIDRPAHLLDDMRFHLAVVNGGLILLAFHWLKQLWGWKVAFGAASLLALDPFFLSESRMLRSEALYTAFMGLSVVTLILYLRGQGRYLWYSGILGGLAAASKISGLFLAGFAPLVITIYQLKPTSISRWKPNLSGTTIRQLLKSWLIWELCFGLTLVLLWPILWVNPMEIIGSTISTVENAAIQGRSGELLFLGQLWDELPIYYYLWVIPYRITPVVMLGLGIAGYYLLRQSPHRDSLLILFGLALLYTFIMSMAANKHDRYMLTTIWAINLMAGWGLIELFETVGQRLSHRHGFRYAYSASLSLGLLSIIMLQTVWVSRAHPYYTAYYNDLLGGLEQAQHIFQLGYGEGVAQVIEFLNTEPEADKAVLVCGTNAPRCSTNFRGTTWQSRTFNSVNGRWILADYALIYINQRQRDLYSPGLLTYLEQHQSLRYVSRINGLPYAWLYTAPQAERSAVARLTGVATMLGYSLTGQAQAGQTLELTTYWQNEEQPDKTFLVSLIDPAGYTWLDEQILSPRPGFEPVINQNDSFIESTARLTLPIGMPSGPYFLDFGFRLAKEPKVFLRFKLDREQTKIQIDAAPPGTHPPTVLHPLDQQISPNLALIGHNLETTSLQTGQELWLPLVWQATDAIETDYVILIRLLDDHQQEIAYWLGRPIQSSQSTANWTAGQVIEDPWHVPIPDNLKPGRYQFELALFDAETQAEVSRVSLQTVELGE